MVDILGPRRCRSVWPGTLLAIAIVGLEPCGQVHCEAVISVLLSTDGRINFKLGGNFHREVRIT